MSPAVTTPSTGTYALLGLLALRSWTGYELVTQAQRSLRHLWPTSEAHLYREQKRLVKLGWASAEAETVGKRPRKRYSITPAGRRALAEWSATEPAPPMFEIEGIVRVFFGDQGTVDDLADSMRTTARQAREILDEMLDYVDEYLDTGGPFPDRLPLVTLSLEVFADMLTALEGRLTERVADVEKWDTTVDRGFDADTRRRLEALRDRHRGMSRRS